MRSVLFFLLFWNTVAALAQETLSIEQVMTPEELKSTGVTSLSPAQRVELNRWLNQYTLGIMMAKKKNGEDCNLVIESRIDGDFNGWDGETIYKLSNGDIWQQASYHYHYHYAYAPKVTIYPSGLGCDMLVDGDHDRPIAVRKLK